MSVLLYWHTLRHLQRMQVVARATRRWRSVSVALEDAQRVRAHRGRVGIDPWRACALRDGDDFTFLNETRRVVSAGDWNAAGVPKLWLYNLHYFDWINARAASTDASLPARAVRWMRRWIAENPPPYGNGWEPYPLSLRIVNWSKWLLREPAPDREAVEEITRSLATQAHVLSQCLETDLLGNHLFENAKALLFAGCYFEGPAADAWFARGAGVLVRELSQQILADGAHFELSPMYHALVLEGVLDVLSLAQAYPERPWRASDLDPSRLAGIASSMLDWLRALTHPDGRIALLNDAAFAIAADPALLERYAKQAGVEVPATHDTDRVRVLAPSGFVRVDRGPVSAVLDVAKIGPDHVPGHGHADTLTFEWSLGGERVVVDSGTSLYAEGGERLRQRGTAAHNTVVVDGRDSSEVWKAFRDARRAYPRDVQVELSGEPWRVAATHDGYRRLRGRVVHRREWQFGHDALYVVDRVDGEHAFAHSRFHFHPSVDVQMHGAKAGELRTAGGRAATFAISNGRGWLEPSTYHPEFGCSVPNTCLVVELRSGLAGIAFGYEDGGGRAQERLAERRA
jgi:uncharacterized heparinase superfamily protein